MRAPRLDASGDFFHLAILPPAAARYDTSKKRRVPSWTDRTPKPRNPRQFEITEGCGGTGCKTPCGRKVCQALPAALHMHIYCFRFVLVTMMSKIVFFWPHLQCSWFAELCSSEPHDRNAGWLGSKIMDCGSRLN